MRLIFLGSGAFGLPTLERLVAEHQVLAVVTQPDRPAGRKRRLTPTPIGQWAGNAGLDLLKATDVNQPRFIDQLDQLQADAAVVIAFGQKLAPDLLEACGELAINLHGSLVPQYRGAAPINWAVIDGQAVTGVSVIGLASEMDAGPVYAKAKTDIDPDQTAGALHDRLAELGPELITHVLAEHAHHRLTATPQDDARATKAPKLHKADGTVDFDQSAQQVRARIHGLTPWPGCRVCWHHQGQARDQPLILQRVSVEHTEPIDTAAKLADLPPGTVLANGRITTAQGIVRLLEVKPPGSKSMTITDFLHGHELTPQDRLSPWPPS